MRRAMAFFVFFVSFSVVYVSVAYYILSPRASQPFMAIGVYSESGTLSAYTGGFPLPVPENQPVRWTLEVVNEMETVQYTRIVYRLGNSTTRIPSGVSPSPDDVPVLGELESFVAKDETRRFEFTWTIIGKTQFGGAVHLNLSVNGVIIASPTQIGAALGSSFRLVFELWTFDLNTNSFQYGWPLQSSRVGTWLQVWFDVVA